jgi:hypothetical protein
MRCGTASRLGGAAHPSAGSNKLVSFHGVRASSSGGRQPRPVASVGGNSSSHTRRLTGPPAGGTLAWHAEQQRSIS